MKTFLIHQLSLAAVLLLALTGSPLQAQPEFSGHVVAGPAWNTQPRLSPTPSRFGSPLPSGTRFLFGGGGEVRLSRVLAIGADAVGFSNPGPGKSSVLLSPNAYAHLLSSTNRLQLDPFLTGGYSVLFRPGSKSGWNFGGGVNYWFSRRAGVRLEVRDSLFSDPGRTRRLWTGRFGIVIR